MRQLGVNLKVVLTHNKIAALCLSVVVRLVLVAAHLRGIIANVLSVSHGGKLVIGYLADGLIRKRPHLIDVVKHRRGVFCEEEAALLHHVAIRVSSLHHRLRVLAR